MIFTPRPCDRQIADGLRSGIEDLKTLDYPLIDGSKAFAIELHRHRQERRVPACGRLPDFARTWKGRSELVDVVAGYLVMLAFEPELRLGCLVHEQPFLFDPGRKERESVLVSNAVDDEREFEFGRLRGRFFVESEGRMDQRLLWKIDAGCPNQSLRVLHRMDERRLPAGVGAIDDGRT